MLCFRGAYFLRGAEELSVTGEACETVREERILEFICTQASGALAQVALGELPGQTRRVISKSGFEETSSRAATGGCPERVVYRWVTEQRAKYHGRA